MSFHYPLFALRPVHVYTSLIPAHTAWHAGYCTCMCSTKTVVVMAPSCDIHVHVHVHTYSVCICVCVCMCAYACIDTTCTCTSKVLATLDYNGCHAVSSLTQCLHMNVMLQPELEDDKPCYIFYRLDERNAHQNYLWVFMAYTPDHAMVS